MPLPLLSFDLSGAVRPEFGVTESELAALAPRLAHARGEILGRDPLDFSTCGFIHLPDLMLAAYQKERAASELGRMMSAAARLREKVDRVVVLGSGAALLGAQALLAACCQPYFNELSRGERGGYPRIYFADNHPDNDAAQGLLHLLGGWRAAVSRDDHWGLVVIDENTEATESADAFHNLFAALCGAYGGDVAEAVERTILISSPKSRLNQQFQALDCRERFTLPDGVNGPLNVLSAAGLIPAALMGLDILKLLEGAKALNDHLRTAPPAINNVLRFVGVTHLLETKGKADLRVLCPWASSLETAGKWCAHLLAERLGKRLAIAFPTNLRAMAARAGDRDDLLVNLLVDEWRFDPLAAGGRTLPDLWIAQVEAQKDVHRTHGQPAVELRLPGTTPHALGQFFQFWMLAVALEGRFDNI